jgi:hypothetical protein
MKPANLTVLQLFEKQQRYVVPLFQRQYIWTLERQWESLWEDISYKTVEILEQKIGEHREIYNHFLGAVVLMTIKTQGLEMWAKSIIDGQQRLTTLQIILFALRDLATKINYSTSLQTLALHTENIAKKETVIEKYKVWPTRADQVIFENIFKAGSFEKLCMQYPLVYEKGKKKPNPLPTLVEAYKFFYKSVDEFVNGEWDNGLPWPSDIELPSPEERIDALISAFKNNLEIVTIDLDDSDNPQVIFETLNFRGEPLRPSDLIRNYIFLEANQNKIPIDSLYDSYWYGFDKPLTTGKPGFWKQEESVGRSKIQHLDLFIYHFLSYVSDHEILLTRTYPEFKEWWQNTSLSFEDELKRLVRLSKLFKEFYNPDTNSRLGIFQRRLLKLDISTIYPLLLYLLGERQDLDDTEINKWVISLESFLIRRLVCGFTAKNYNNVFRVLLENLKKMDHPCSDDLNSMLLEYSKDSNRWPDNKEFQEGWYSKNAYNRRGAMIVLEAIDLQMMTSKQEKIHIESKLTIEHLLPQKWTEENYPFVQSAFEETQETMAINRNALIHTDGNLTLLTKGLNAAVSNGPFGNKRPEIAVQSLLKMNSYFQAYRDIWAEEDIHKRGKELFKIAKIIWPFPTEN